MVIQSETGSLFVDANRTWILLFDDSGTYRFDDLAFLTVQGEKVTIENEEGHLIIFEKNSLVIGITKGWYGEDWTWETLHNGRYQFLPDGEMRVIVKF